jgi:hypothetical protein
VFHETNRQTDARERERGREKEKASKSTREKRKKEGRKKGIPIMDPYSISITLNPFESI